MDAEAIVEALADDGPERRGAALDAIEAALERPSTTTSERDSTVALAVACVKPLTSVLSAHASRVDEVEHRRAALVLYKMTKLDISVCGKFCAKDDEGAMPLSTVYGAPASALANVVAKEPQSWTREDAITAAASLAAVVPIASAGFTAVSAVAGEDSEMAMLEAWLSSIPYFGPEPADRYVPLALLCMDLARSEVDEHPEGIIVGAWFVVSLTASNNPLASKAVFERGFLDAFQASIAAFNPMELVSRQLLISSALLDAVMNATRGAQAAGVEVVQPLLDAGAVDVAISILTAYQMLGDPDEACNISVTLGSLYFLEVGLGSARDSEKIVAKLRRAGVECIRYLLDNPLSMIASLGLASGVQATKIAAMTWGRDDDVGGLSFKQQDIDNIVHVADHRGPGATLWPMRPNHGRYILSLSISDRNKELLLSAEGFLPLLVDSLLLDPEHPRMENNTMMGETTDWEGAKGPVQRDFAETIAQLAMFSPGRDALLQDPSVAEALQRVAVEGWTEEARMHAESALLAMSDRQQPEALAHDEQHELRQKHIMLSYQVGAERAAIRLLIGQAAC